MLVALLLSTSSFACWCDQEIPTLIGPANGPVPKEFAAAFSFDSSAQSVRPSSVWFETAEGERAPAYVTVVGSHDRKWVVAHPDPSVAVGEELRLVFEGDWLGTFQVHADPAVEPARVSLLRVKYDVEAPGAFFDSQSSRFLPYPCNPRGPLVNLSVATPNQGAGWLEIQHDVSSSFDQAQVVLSPVKKWIAVGYGECGPADAALPMGRRVYFRVRTVGEDGSRGIWSSVGSVEIGNLDSDWPPAAPVPPPTALVNALRLVAGLLGILASLVAWALVRGWIRRR